MSLRHRRAISASRTSIDGEVSATRFPVAMTTDGPTRNSARTANGRRTRRVLAVSVRDLDRMRADGGLSIRQLADAAKVDPGYLSLILRGARQPTIGVLVAVASALGADMSIRAYPTTGPVIHDRIQARIVEELLRFAAPTWIRYVEVPVFRPARGFIDVVFGSTALATIVATEVESRIDRLEQQLRWAQEKAASLPSAEMWGQGAGDQAISRLLVLRSSAANRAIVDRFTAVLATGYPARSAEAYDSLGTGSPWPGPAILWADVSGDVVRIRDRPPKGVAVGR